VEDQVDLSLLGNGLDYLDSAVEQLRSNPGPRQLKYAVLHLHAGVEVLLKARLVREDWSLIFPKPDKATHRDFMSGNFRSIGIPDAIIRLREDVGVDVPQPFQDNITRLTRTRNKLQHFGMRDDQLAVESLVGEVLDAIWNFMASDLRPGASPEEEGLFDRTHELILGETQRIKALVEARMQRIAPDIDANADHVLTCPDCLKFTLKLDPENCHPCCLFCTRAWVKGEEAAKDYAESVLRITWHDVIADGELSPLHFCPECSVEAFVRGAHVRHDPDKALWVCFNCGESAEEDHIDMCAICGRPVMTTGGSLACASCWREAVGGAW
jgi:hypothetical protein